MTLCGHSVTNKDKLEEQELSTTWLKPMTYEEP